MDGNDRRSLLMSVEIGGVRFYHLVSVCVCVCVVCVVCECVVCECMHMWLCTLCGRALHVCF